MSDDAAKMFMDLVAKEPGLLMEWTAKNAFRIYKIVHSPDGIEETIREYKIEEIK